MQDVVGTKPSKWCAGCHDHAVFFNGRFDRPIKEQIDTPEAQAGLACTSCHSITHVHSSMGQGDFTIEYPPLHDLAASENPVLRRMHDRSLYLAPQPHRDTFMKPFHREQTAEFCSSCHKVHLDVPVNGYRWFRGFNDYDNWQASGVSGQGARSFYYPPTPQTLRRLPHAARRLERSGGEERQGAVAPVSRREHGAAVRQPRRGAAEGGAGLPPRRADLGRRVRHRPRRGRSAGRPGQHGAARAAAVEHVRGRRGIGSVRRRPRPCRHAAGRSARAARTRSMRSCAAANRFGSKWSCGRARSVTSSPAGPSMPSTSGSSSKRSTTKAASCCTAARWPTEGKGPVEPGAHFYRSLQLDEHGNPINKRNAWSTRSVAYVRLIPPGAADTVHYRLRLPKDAGRHDLSAGQGELPEVRLVEHAVGVRRRARSGGRQPGGQPLVRRWPVGVHRRYVEGVGADQGDSRHPDRP